MEGRGGEERRGEERKVIKVLGREGREVTMIYYRMREHAP